MDEDNELAVLLIEDNDADATFAKELLPLSFSVTHATTLESMRNLRHKFDVILLDLSLPDADGLEAFEEVMDWSNSKVPVVILTGLDHRKSAIQAVQKGAQDYILKKDINEHNLPRIIWYAKERKRFEEQRKKLALYEQYEEFVAMLGHDLRNPLIAANRILDLLVNDKSLGSISKEAEDVLRTLRDSNVNLLKMIQNLIEIYRFEHDPKIIYRKKVDVARVLRAKIREMQPLAESREVLIGLECEDTCIAFIDDNAISRLLQNLVDNALKFSAAGGEVRIKLEHVEELLVLSVLDNGPGISAEEQKTLFDRFAQGRTGRRYHSGTGLGLYLCRQIAEAHLGKIECLSAEGTGTKFVVSIPFSQ